MNNNLKKGQSSCAATPALAGLGRNGAQEHGVLTQESPCSLRTPGNSPVAEVSLSPRECLGFAPPRNSHGNNYHQVVLKESDLTQVCYGK